MAAFSFPLCVFIYGLFLVLSQFTFLIQTTFASNGTKGQSSLPCRLALALSPCLSLNGASVKFALCFFHGTLSVVLLEVIKTWSDSNWRVVLDFLYSFPRLLAFYSSPLWIGNSRFFPFSLKLIALLFLVNVK